MKNQYRLDDLVTLVNVDGKWWAISKEVGEFIGYSRPSIMFNKHCTEGETIVKTVQQKDQRRAVQLVSRVGIYELLEKTSLDIPDEKVKWICEKLIKTMKAMNEESCPQEVEMSKIECKERNQKKDTSKLEKVKENSINKNRINQLEKDKDRLLKDIESRNIRNRELAKDKESLEETIRHKDLKIQDKIKRIEELKYELKNTNKLNRDLEMEILYLDSEIGIEKVELLESNLEDANFKINSLEKDRNKQQRIISEYQIDMREDKENIKELDNIILDLTYKNKELKKCKCLLCRLKGRFYSWLL